MIHENKQEEEVKEKFVLKTKIVKSMLDTCNLNWTCLGECVQDIYGDFSPKLI